MLKVGESIPKFELDVFVVDNIKKIKFSDLRGKWLILIFYPADFTCVCPTELEQASELYGDFKNLGTEIMSLSTDTAYSHKAWHSMSKAVGKVKLSMFSDPSGKVCRMFGTYIEDEGLSLRATFIVNPDGKVMSLEMHDTLNIIIISENIFH